jgi:ion channel-forming bestrophin family protein
MAAEAYVKPGRLEESRSGIEGPDTFWREAFAIRGAVTLQILSEVLIFTLIALGICVLEYSIDAHIWVDVTPVELAGAALGLLLVMRTNAGYDRWWEGRKLWGSIVNQSRELTLTCLAHGPDDPDWRERLVRWTAAYAHVCRRGLRSERSMPEVAALLGVEAADRLSMARHMPGAVSLRIALILREGCERFGMDRFAFLEAEQSRTQLIDSIGGCERILKSPLPRVCGINIRRFILVFLITLPFGILQRTLWLTPLVVFLVSYPILALDQIGVELQNPFSVKNLGHLPLDEISANIEADLKALLADRSFRPLPEPDTLISRTG